MPSPGVTAGPAVQQARLSVLRIRPLGPDAKDRQTATARLVKKFEGEAPHHLVGVFVDGSQLERGRDAGT
eukprot:1161954-Pelagomonas_calceolata.AAC.3